tara:strand:+ start:2651 stop:3157 length:507 start_codon:yes stop_codon:yes gene_type:complete
MISRLLLYFLFIVCFSCNSGNSEQKLLNKSNPSGLYGNMSKTDKVYGVDELIHNKNDYMSSIVKVEGVIVEVCPMRGCWLQVIGEDDKNKKIRIKVKDGDIVFPLSSKGHKVLAEGQFSVLKLNEKQAKNWKKHLAAEKGINIDTASIVLTDNDYFEYRLNTSGAQIF